MAPARPVFKASLCKALANVRRMTLDKETLSMIAAKHTESALAKWIARRPGRRARLVRDTGLSAPTVDRARAGLPVSPETARLLSQATNGRVRVRDIVQCAPKAGQPQYLEDEDDGDADVEPCEGDRDTSSAVA